MDLARELKKTIEHEGDSDTSCDWCTWTERTEKGTGRVGNQRTSRDYPNYSIIEIGQNTEKGPGDLRRLAVTQMLSANAGVKNSQPI